MSLFAELKRRNVFRAAVAYGVGAWFIVQIADIVLNNIGAPDWVIKVLFLLLAIGFVVAMIVSWAYEITPEGLKRDSEVRHDESISYITAKRLDYITLAAVLGVASMFVWQQLGDDGDPSSTSDGVSPDLASDMGPDPGPARLPKLGSQSIAVLPFANRSNLENDRFFTDGIHDDLLTQLAKIHDLKVISRTSVMAYRGTTKKMSEIADELGVARVLEGGVQRAGQRIRINAQLTDVVSDDYLWAETFDREMTIANLFDIQSEITRQIITAVKGQMTPEEQQILATAPTQNIAAYEAYLHAGDLILSSGYNMEKFKDAQPFVEQAIALDPNFGLAHVRLAEIHGMAYWIGYDVTPARRQAAGESLERATALLGLDSPDVLWAQGNYYYRFEQNYPAALNALLKAHAAMPGNTEVLGDVGLTQRRLGLWEEAVASLLQAAELDPADVAVQSIAAETLLFMRQWSRAEEVLLPALSRFPDDSDLAASSVFLPLWKDGDTNTARERYRQMRPDSGESFVFTTIELPWYQHDFAGVIDAWAMPEVLEFAATEGYGGFRELSMAQAYLRSGQPDRAHQLLAEAEQILADLDRNRRDLAVADDLSTLAIVLALQGKKERAIDVAEEATEIHTLASDTLEGTWPVKWLGYVLALTGERDRALEIIEQLIDQPAGYIRWELYLDPRWDFFRDDERFNKLIRPDNLEQSIHGAQSGSD